MATLVSFMFCMQGASEHRAGCGPSHHSQSSVLPSTSVQTKVTSSI